MKRALWFVAAGLVLATVSSQAETGQTQPRQQTGTPSASNMEILRQKVKADRKLVVATNMGLTDAEGQAFWPVYDAYQVELSALNGRIAKLIGAYAQAYNAGPIPDDTAKSLVTELMAVDQAELALRQNFLPKFQAALPGAKLVRYLQIENKIRAVLKYELAAAIPLAQ